MVLSFQKPSPFCHPERTRISYITALNSATYVVLPKENHMQLTEAATLDRKSGEAEGSAVRPSGASHAPGSHKIVIDGAKRLTDSSRDTAIGREVEGPRRCLIKHAAGSFSTTETPTRRVHVDRKRRARLNDCFCRNPLHRHYSEVNVPAGSPARL